MLNPSLISQPFGIRSLPKVYDFQTAILQTYLSNVMRTGKALFKLSSRQVSLLQKNPVIGHVRIRPVAELSPIESVGSSIQTNIPCETLKNIYHF